MPAQRTLLFIAHAPSENTKLLANAVLKGASNSDIENVDVRCLSPIETQPDDINSAHAIIIGTTENLGYMAGLVKDVFDRCYYDCIKKTQGRHFSFYVPAGQDSTRTKREIETNKKGVKGEIGTRTLNLPGGLSTRVYQAM